jgi:hypothetical protein
MEGKPMNMVLTIQTFMLLAQNRYSHIWKTDAAANAVPSSRRPPPLGTS